MSKQQVPLLLAASIALALSCSTLPAVSSPSPTVVNHAPISAAPALIDLREVYPALSTANSEQTRQFLAERVFDANRPTLKSSGKIPIALVDVRLLSSEEIIEAARTLFEFGVPLAIYQPRHVTHEDSNRTFELFGFASKSDLTIYTKGTKSGIRTFSTFVDNDHAPSDTEDRIARMTRDIEEHLNSASTESIDSSFPDNNPVIEVVDTKYEDDGNFITQKATVARDSSPARDNFVVVYETQESMWNPHRRSLGQRLYPWHDMARRYSVKHRLSESHDARLAATEFSPRQSLTAVDVSDKVTTKTSFGFGLDSEASNSLGPDGSSSVKPKFGFNFGKDATRENGISYQIDDFYVLASQSFENRTYQQSWLFHLAESVEKAARKNNFAPTPLTPGMRMIEAETLSKWVISAKANGILTLSAVTSATTAIRDIAGKPLMTLAETDNLSIDLSSPFLTREPTVMLKSKANEGLCLVNPGSTFTTVRLGQCDSRPSNRAAQWYLDPDERYVSRLDGRCLAVSATSSAEVWMANCGQSLNQKWYWASDRIQSRHDGGDKGWRLYVDGSSVKARIDPRKQSVIPDNVNHVLLAPWSNYPQAPVPGATIPKFNGKQSDVPAQWISGQREVTPSERWMPIPLRQYRQ